MVRSDGEDWFNLKAENVERSHSNNFIAKSVLNAAGEVVGRDVDLGFETYSVQGVIQDTQTGTYPPYETIDKEQYNAAVEKEINLSEAVNRWGPTAGDGFDKLHWGPREIPGMVTKFSSTEDATGERGPGKFTFSLEWTYANIIV